MSNGTATGNTAALVKDVFEKNSDALNAFSDTIGTLADFAGAWGAIVGAATFVANLIDKVDQTQSMLQEILTVIQQDFAQLHAEDKANHIITRMTNLVNVVGYPKAVLDSLRAMLNPQHEPPTDSDRTEQIENCIAALEQLSPDILWEDIFSYQIYWSDVGQHVDVFQALNPPPYSIWITYQIDRGYGAQQPAGGENDMVFNYLYISAYYLFALSLFLTVATALDTTYISDYKDTVLRPAAKLLRTRHDQIKSGIRPLSPGYWDGKKLVDFFGPVIDASNASRNWPGITPLRTSVVGSYSPNPPYSVTTVLTTGASIEYGAVEVFSGYSSIGNCRIALGSSQGEIPSDAPDVAPYNKFQIRLMKTMVDVYAGVGLPILWQAMNHINSIVGDPQLPLDDLAYLSFRRMLSLKIVPADATGNWSLSALARFLKYTPPLDTAASPVTSFRNLLTPV
jgi:hypothetical protein